MNLRFENYKHKKKNHKTTQIFFLFLSFFLLTHLLRFPQHTQDKQKIPHKIDAAALPTKRKQSSKIGHRTHRFKKIIGRDTDEKANRRDISSYNLGLGFRTSAVIREHKRGPKKLALRETQRAASFARNGKTCEKRMVSGYIYMERM